MMIYSLRAGLAILTSKFCACIDVVTGRIELERLIFRIDIVIHSVLHYVDPPISRTDRLKRGDRIAAIEEKCRV